MKEISRLGFYKEKGGKGSHEKWCHGSSGRKLIVPRNLKVRATANGILKDAGSDLKL